MELKSCPFCGSEEIYSFSSPHFGFAVVYEQWEVRCSKCSAKINRMTQKGAEEAWNRRVKYV